MIDLFLNIFIVVLILVLVSFLCYILYNGKSKTSTELFPLDRLYIENALEDADFFIDNNDKKDQEKIASKYRGSIRMALGAYFTIEEYTDYKKSILAKELP